VRCYVGSYECAEPGSSLGQLIKIIREPQMELVVDKLTEFSTSTDEELRDISGLGIFLLVEPFLDPWMTWIDSSQDDHC
jgi:hypothetical protein